MTKKINVKKPHYDFPTYVKELCIEADKAVWLIGYIKAILDNPICGMKTEDALSSHLELKLASFM